jgi:predicted nucleic acid-binding protein
MIHSLYVDTSALAKSFLNEPASERFRAFFRQQAMPPAISTLTVLELRCLLGRRRRAGDIGSDEEELVVSALEQQIQVGLMAVCALEDSHARAAIDLLAELRVHSLRTLDALHLAIARDLKVQTLATSDGRMADAAGALGLGVELFV